MNIQLHDSTDISDQILENYIALLRHATGDRRLLVTSGKKHPKRIRQFEPKISSCVDCKQEFMKKAFHHRFCGSYSEKTGCSYRRSVENQKKYWKKWGKK